MIYGECEYTSRCCYAHGDHELVSKDSVIKNYKKVKCNKFFNKGYCPYGNRCQYIHEERRLEEIISHIPFYINLFRKQSDSEYNEDYSKILTTVGIKFSKFSNLKNLNRKKEESEIKNGNSRLPIFKKLFTDKFEQTKILTEKLKSMTRKRKITDLTEKYKTDASTNNNSFSEDTFNPFTEQKYGDREVGEIIDFDDKKCKIN